MTKVCSSDIMDRKLTMYMGTTCFILNIERYFCIIAVPVGPVHSQQPSRNTKRIHEETPLEGL